MDPRTDDHAIDTALGRAADAVGLVTLAIGTSLVVAPRRAAAALGLGDGPAVALGIGVSDVVVGVGLLRGRPRWPWMVARTVLNVAFVGAYRAEAGRPGGNTAARTGARRMSLLAVLDGALAATLAARHR